MMGLGENQCKIVYSNASFKSAGATLVQADMIMRRGD